MYKVGQDIKMCRCLTTLEAQFVLKELYEGVVRGHFVIDIIAKKILNARYWWPTLFNDSQDFCKSCDNCKKNGGIKTNRFYMSNQTNKKNNRKHMSFGSYRSCNQVGRSKGT
jgi:hypothetical protein